MANNLSLDDLSKAHERLAEALVRLPSSNEVRKETEAALISISKAIVNKIRWEG